jgi:hypothetical protein
MNRLRFSICLLICLLVTACGGSSKVAARHPPGQSQRAVVLDQKGRGYAATDLFHINPHGPWGVAYAYDCGAHAGDFSGEIIEVENAVDLPYTLFTAHGTHGQGLRMETGSTSNITMPNGKQAGIVLGVRIKTVCAWHVRVVQGVQAAVAQSIPTKA